MLHGIRFGNKHSYDDWNLVPTSRPVIDPPEPKTIYIDIPGSDGTLDLTQSLTGDIKYNNRKGSFEFQVDRSQNWTSVYSEILDYLHGRSLQIIMDDDPDYYYIGRAQVNAWKSNKNFSTITIDVLVEPYKLERFSSLEDWEWDSFNFEDGIIREYKNIVVDGSLVFYIEGRRKPVIPTFTVATTGGEGMTVRYNNVNYTLAEGTSRVLSIILREGSNRLQFTGNGTVTIDYRGGRL